MPMMQIFNWELTHEWKSGYYEDLIADGNWTEEKMTDELRELENFRKQKNLPFTLTELIDLIIENQSIITVGNKRYDFSVLTNIFHTWNHISQNCDHYGREWVAQDESYLKCFKGHDTNSCGEDCLLVNCPDYKPMVKLPSLKTLMESEKVLLT